MARRSSSGNLFVGCVAGGLVLIGIALYLRDRGLLRLPEPTPKAPAQRAEDLAKKYPDAEVFAAPEVDKKKSEVPAPVTPSVPSQPIPPPQIEGPPLPPMGKEVRRAEPIATDKPRDTIEMAGWQTLLDRLNFSCGTIDGHFAKRSRRAITQFQIHRALATTGEIDIETRINLGKPGDAYSDYTVSEEDFRHVIPKPKGFLAMSKIPILDFNDPWEMLAEKTHSTPSFLKELNSTVTNLVVGTQLTLPNLEGTRKLPPVSRIVIMISETTLLAFDTNNKVVACFPCSIAADKTKVPNLPLTVANIAPNPNYTFDPKVLTVVAQQEGITNKLVLPPGPNNPVGTAWIGLSLQGYGIHGTPEPEDISRTGSHGCFRLANWNASKLVRAVRPGIPVEVVP